MRSRDGDRRRRRMGGIFDANSIPNLALWLRGDSGVTKDGADAISQWDFKNGAFRGVSNVAQGAGANQPTHIPVDSSYNNKPTISFDGGDYLDGNNWSSVLAQPNTYFIVGEWGGVAETFIDRDGGVGRNQHAVAGANKNTLYAGATLTSGANADTSPHIYDSVFNGVSSEINIDGSIAATGDAGAQSSASLRVGDNIVLTGPLTGKIAEIISYNGIVSATDLTIIRNYLSARYSITI